MSHRSNTETGQRHPNDARTTAADGGSASEASADDLTWPFLSPALTDCSECRRGRRTAISGGNGTGRSSRSTEGRGDDAATTVESDTGAESVRLDPGNVATLYAAVRPCADLLSVHVHADPAYTVRLRGPGGDVRRAISAAGDSGDSVGVATWTVEAPPRGQWTVEVRAPADAPSAQVSVTFGTLADEEAPIPSPDSSE